MESDAETQQLMDAMLWLRFACRNQPSFKTECLSTISQRTLAAALPPLHDISHQAICLKSGVLLGTVKT